MTNTISTSAVLLNLLSNRFYRFVFFVCILVLIIFPFWGMKELVTSFNKQLITSVENEAVRTVKHLTTMFPHDELLIYERLLPDLHKVTQDLSIEKIIYMLPSGTIVFSTDYEDIGEINKHDFFTDIVLRGKIFSKMMPQNSTSDKGRIIFKDIAQIYVPVLNDEAVTSIFGIFYNISERKQSLHAFFYKTGVIVIAGFLTLFVFLLVLLYTSSKQDLLLNSSKQKLEDLEDSTNYKIKEKTFEIIVNQNIMVETLAVFAEYYEDGTDKHLDRIQNYVKILGKHLGNDPLYANYINSKPNYIKEVALASLLHDIGKITIPKEILTKTGRLTSKEFELVKTIDEQHLRVKLKLHNLTVQCSAF